MVLNDDGLLPATEIFDDRSVGEMEIDLTWGDEENRVLADNQEACHRIKDYEVVVWSIEMQVIASTYVKHSSPMSQRPDI